MCLPPSSDPTWGQLNIFLTFLDFISLNCSVKGRQKLPHRRSRTVLKVIVVSAKSTTMGHTIFENPFSLLNRGKMTPSLSCSTCFKFRNKMFKKIYQSQMICNCVMMSMKCRLLISICFLLSPLLDSKYIYCTIEWTMQTNFHYGNLYFFRLDGRVAVQGLVLMESCFPPYLKKTSFSIIAIVIVCCYLLCLKI